MATSETARLLTPLSVAGALALAAGVWFVPLPEPGGPAPIDENYRARTTTNTGPSIVPVGKTGPHDWLALEEPFYELRDEVIIPTPPGTDIDPQPVLPPVTVRYLGFVGASEERVAALLDIEGTQRFVSVGQVISIPNRDDLRITEITPQTVAYEIAETPYFAHREQRSNAPATRTPDAQPMNPPMRPDMRPDEDALRGVLPAGGPQ